MNQTIYVLVGGKVQEAEARIAGETAFILLPFGQEKAVKYPAWQASQAEAEAEIKRRQLVRIERARRVVAMADNDSRDV